MIWFWGKYYKGSSSLEFKEFWPERRKEKNEGTGTSFDCLTNEDLVSHLIKVLSSFNVLIKIP